MTTKVADEVASEKITAYDQSHLAIYLRLLDAQVDGASREEMARVVLDIRIASPIEQENPSTATSGTPTGCANTATANRWPASFTQTEFSRAVSSALHNLAAA